MVRTKRFPVDTSIPPLTSELRPSPQMNGITQMFGGITAYGVTFYHGTALAPWRICPSLSQPLIKDARLTPRARSLLPHGRPRVHRRNLHPRVLARLARDGQVPHRPRKGRRARAGPRQPQRNETEQVQAEACEGGRARPQDMVAHPPHVSVFGSERRLGELRLDAREFPHSLALYALAEPAPSSRSKASASPRGKPCCCRSRAASSPPLRPSPSAGSPTASRAACSRSSSPSSRPLSVRR